MSLHYTDTALSSTKHVLINMNAKEYIITYLHGGSVRAHFIEHRHDRPRCELALLRDSVHHMSAAEVLRYFVVERYAILEVLKLCSTVV